MKRFPLLLLLFISAIPALAQKERDSISIKAIAVKKLLSEADTLSSEEAYNLNINEEITKQLTAILSIPSIVHYSIDSLLEHRFLGITHSDDKRLWIFSWYENTGGTFHSNLNLIQYRTAANKPVVVFNNNSEDNTNGFSASGAWIDVIHPLKSKSSNLYLCGGSVVGCGTCYAEVLSLIELKNDSINFNYPAFADSNEPNKFSSGYFLDSRYGSILKFEYNNKKQKISYAYMPDDNTPITANTRKTKVTGTLTFNGKQFVEVVK
jgi:hypothetical protein